MRGSVRVTREERSVSVVLAPQEELGGQPGVCIVLCVEL